MKTNFENLNKLVTGTSGWIENANARKESQGWLKHSQKIAIKVLGVLRDKKIKQTELALSMGVSPQQVSKIVKGRENLTLETISKLEQVLGVSLIKIESQPTVLLPQYTRHKELAYLHIYKQQLSIETAKTSYYKNIEQYTEVNCNEPLSAYGN
jgi:transcriptional regulator with XRE-family HTH domain